MGVIAAVVAYLVAQILLGVWYSRRIRTEDDYLLAGRSLGPWLCTFSVFATWFAAETCVTSAGEVYRRGVVGSTTDPFAYGLAVVLMGFLFAARLRKMGLTTTADLYRRRYGVAVERLSVLLLVPTSVFWAAAQVRAFGQILGALTGMNVETGVALAAAAVIFYTLVGGILADSVTDLLQGLILIVGLAALTIAVIAHGDLAVLASIPRERFALFPADRPLLETLELWAAPVLGSFTAQELISRALAARSVRVAKWSTVGGGLLFVAIGLMPVLLGLIGSQLMPGLKEPEQVLMLQAGQYLPLVLYAVFAGALIAAVLSSVDSSLLSSGALIAHNVVLPLRDRSSGREVGAAERLWTNRAAVAALGIGAYLLARGAETVFELVEDAASFGTAGLLVVFLFAFRENGLGGKWAALATLVTGTVVFHVGEVRLFPYPYLAAVGLSLAVFVGVGALESAWGVERERESAGI
jgi:solute:Na+ symporter, SSS family